ncbi:MAG: helix-turn-helix domain-containing protein [Myxococcota bacterium]
MNDDEARRRERALCRYQVISAYLAIDPPRGRREALRRQLAAKIWRDPDGQPLQVAAETIRVWVRRYRQGGLDALMDKPRARPGVQTLSPEIIERLCALKREVPERSLDRLLRIVEETGQTAPGLVTRSTLHRVLQAAGISGRPPTPSDDDDLDRFESDAPNALWQSDLLKGPWLPDPDKPGKMRRAHLYAFLDDHSRLLLHGRFSFKVSTQLRHLPERQALGELWRRRPVWFRVRRSQSGALSWRATIARG